MSLTLRLSLCFLALSLSLISPGLVQSQSVPNPPISSEINDLAAALVSATSWELMRLDLKADLEVLSACETARSRTSAGEGVIRLTWTLFVAGTPVTVVS